jgi:Na+/H+ antiporter NhaD/arsenite permease-like protein
MDIERAIWIGEEFAGLILFLLATMTYVNALEERRVFQALRACLCAAGFSLRAITGFSSGARNCAASRHRGSGRRGI